MLPPLGRCRSCPATAVYRRRAAVLSLRHRPAGPARASHPPPLGAAARFPAAPGGAVCLPACAAACLVPVAPAVRRPAAWLLRSGPRRRRPATAPPFRCPAAALLRFGRALPGVQDAEFGVRPTHRTRRHPFRQRPARRVLRRPGGLPAHAAGAEVHRGRRAAGARCAAAPLPRRADRTPPVCHVPSSCRPASHHAAAAPRPCLLPARRASSGSRYPVAVAAPPPRRADRAPSNGTRPCHPRPPTRRGPDEQYTPGPPRS